MNRILQSVKVVTSAITGVELLAIHRTLGNRNAAAEGPFLLGEQGPIQMTNLGVYRSSLSLSLITYASS